MKMEKKKKVHTYIQKAIIIKNGKNHHNDVQYIMIMKNKHKKWNESIHIDGDVYLFYICKKKKKSNNLFQKKKKKK